jgi:release factor glutamine methyltransferase
MPINGKSATVKNAFEKGISILKKNNVEAPALEAGVMLCYALKFDKTYIYSHGESIISETDTLNYFDCIEKRASGLPLQYITGQQEFMSLMFNVSPAVLIPRQDTEVLVETVISFANKKSISPVKILDIGTGSGCIAISLAHFLKYSHLTAVDISGAALDIARSNAENAGVSDRIRFIKSDLFKSLGNGKNGKDRFDIIVSNPPYIPTVDIQNLQVEVKCHEPAAALDGGLDGLEFYRSIIEEAPVFLNSNGLLAFEVGFNQSKEVADLMREKFYRIEIIHDLSNIERVVTGILKNRI